MLIRYVGPHDVIEIGGIDFHPDAGRTCAQGETIDVADDLAGHAPGWVDGEAEPTYDPGAGLLAQPSNWEPVGGGQAERVGEQGPQTVESVQEPARAVEDDPHEEQE